jgi:hypothetical protein
MREYIVKKGGTNIMKLLPLIVTYTSGRYESIINLFFSCLYESVLWIK